MIGVLLLFIIAPPRSEAVLSWNRQLMSVGAQSVRLCTAPPLTAPLCRKIVLMIVGFASLAFEMAPPLIVAVLFSKMQLRMVGLLPTIRMPPPMGAEPSVMVRP